MSKLANHIALFCSHDNTANRRQSHDCSELFRLPRFSTRGSQNTTRDTAHFHVIGNGGDRLCVSSAHCIECYFEGLTAMFDIYLLYAI